MKIRMMATLAAITIALAPMTGCATLKDFGSAVTEEGSTVKEASQGVLGAVLGAAKLILSAAPDFLIMTLGADEEVPDGD